MNEHIQFIHIIMYLLKPLPKFRNAWYRLLQLLMYTSEQLPWCILSKMMHRYPVILQIFYYWQMSYLHISLLGRYTFSHLFFTYISHFYHANGILSLMTYTICKRSLFSVANHLSTFKFNIQMVYVSWPDLYVCMLKVSKLLWFLSKWYALQTYKFPFAC